jgi:hypothetical protein
VTSFPQERDALACKYDAMPDETVNREFYRGGLVRQEIPCRKGLPHGLWRTFHNNGQIESEKPHLDGKLHGVCRQWSWSGKLLGTYEMNHGTGIQRSWYDNGQSCSEFGTVDGEFTGRARHWLADGTLDSDQYLVSGKPVSREEFAKYFSNHIRIPKSEDAAFTPLDLQGPEIERKKIELFVRLLTERPNHDEVLNWLGRHSTECPKILGRFQDVQNAIFVMRQLYDAGAPRVEALDIYAASGQEFCDRIAVFVPNEESARKRIREVCATLKREMDASFSPQMEVGEIVMTVSFN